MQHKDEVAEPVHGLMDLHVEHAQVDHASRLGLEGTRVLSLMNPNIMILQNLNSLRWVTGCASEADGLMEVSRMMPQELFLKASMQEARAWFGLTSS